MKFVFRIMKAALSILLAQIFFPAAQAQTVEVDAGSYVRKTIFTSHPQQCGDGTLNCRHSEWVGTWFMPDGSLMVAFNHATGPTAPSLGRTFMPEELLNRFSLEDGRLFTHKYPASPGFYYFDKGYDFSALSGGCPPSPQIPTTQPCSLVVYLRSSDRGQTWKPWRTELIITGLGTSAYTPQPNIALPNGTLIRRVNGDDLQHLEGIPYSAMLQLLKPVRGAYPAEWPALGRVGQIVVKDANVCKYQVSRIRRLRDGRYIALGQAWPYAVERSRGRCAETKEATNMLLVAASASEVERGVWRRGLPDIPSSILAPNEWDVAELKNGDLLALFRTSVSVSNRTQARKQAILRVRSASECPDRKASGCWVLDRGTLGNPGNLPHSGHPELLATREGVIVQFATTGNSYTTNGGSTWTPLTDIAASDYYPRSIQDPVTGDIYLFGHVGHDDPYGGKSEEAGGNYSGINQSITMQKFRLKVTRSSTN